MDAEQGRIRILPASTIAAGSSILVDYTPKAQSREAAKITGSPKVVTGSVRYVEDATTGEGRDVYIALARVQPNGEPL